MSIWGCFAGGEEAWEAAGCRREAAAATGSACCCVGFLFCCCWTQAHLENLHNGSGKAPRVCGDDNVTLASFYIDASKGWLLFLGGHAMADDLVCVGCAGEGIGSSRKRGSNRVLRNDDLEGVLREKER